MAKLFFRYSAMDAGKTLDLLKVSYNYNDRGQHTLVITSIIDKRAGTNKVKSRIGIDKDAISTTPEQNLFQIIKEYHHTNLISCVLVDEIQFFSIDQINQLSDVVDYLNIPVICYGLRSNYCGDAFPSSAHLLAIADNLEELKTICHCGKKATFNMLIKNNAVIKKGNPVVIDNDNLKEDQTRYMSVCRKHWKEGNFG